MIKKIEGIVVSVVDYKESSKIVNIFSPTEGVIGVLARGTKKIKSNLSGVTDKLTYGYFPAGTDCRHLLAGADGDCLLCQCDCGGRFQPGGQFLK